MFEGEREAIVGRNAVARRPRRQMRSRALIKRVILINVTRRIASQESALQESATRRRSDVIEAFIMIMGEDKIRLSIYGDPQTGIWGSHR